MGILFFLYKRRMNAMKQDPLAVSIKSDSDSEEYWKNRGVESSDAGTRVNPMVMNIQ